MTLLLPLMGFLFISLLITAIGMSLLRGRDRHRTPARRAGRLGSAGGRAHRGQRAPAQHPQAPGQGRAQAVARDRQAQGAADPRGLPRRAKRSPCSSASGSGWRSCSSLLGSSRRPEVEPDDRPGRRGVRLPAAEHGARPAGKAPPAPHPLVAARCARPAGGERRSRSRSRPGHPARGRRAGVRASGAVRRTAADQPRAPRRQGAQPKRSATWPSAPASTISRRWRRC